ncbi:unnamed protein product [Sympodiomycopsis kandeliae]
MTSQESSTRHGAWPSVGPSYPGQGSSSTPGYEYRGGRGGRGGGRGRGGRGGRGRGRGGHSSPTNAPIAFEDGKTGNLVCGYLPDDPSSSSTASVACAFRSNSQNAMILHKADRHLIYPPGGKEELDRLDPLLIEERKEQARRAKKQQRQRQAQEEGDAEKQGADIMNTIPGLNISLSTPELVAQWIAERKKRWPSDKVVQKKVEEAWDDSSRGQLSRDRQRQQRIMETNKRKHSEIEGDNDAKTNSPKKDDDDDDDGSSDSDSSSDSGSDSDSDSDSELSGSDAPSEEPIGRGHDNGHIEQETSTTKPSQPVCHFFQQGRCSYGDRCNKSHDVSQRPQATLNRQPASNIPDNRRPRPRNPPQNPFEPRNLLHALLKNEIRQHVSTVAQLTRFLVRNDFLKGVELQPGMAEAQKKRRERIQEVQPGSAALEEPAPDLDSVVHEGGLPTLASTDDDSSAKRSLYRPPSPTLRALTSLSWPPEPDPLIFMDPLRRDDPKPLTNEQFELLATDAELRDILRPVTPIHPNGEPRPGLERALKTLDDLPSDEHRRAALELIMGVSAQTPIHAHQIGPTYVNPAHSNTRFIGEVELFKLGLRCNPTEQEYIQAIGKRITEVLSNGTSTEYEPNPSLSLNDYQRQENLSFREEQRRAHWEREADRRDLLRKLGVDVD